MEMSQAEETGTLRLSQDTALTGRPGGSSLYDFISGFSTWLGSHLEWQKWSTYGEWVIRTYAFIKTQQTVRLRSAQFTVCKLPQLKGTTPTAGEPAASGACDSEYLTSLGRRSLGPGRSPSPLASSSQGMSILPEPVCPAHSNLARGLGANTIPTPGSTPGPPSRFSPPAVPCQSGSQTRPSSTLRAIIHQTLVFKYINSSLKSL